MLAYFFGGALVLFGAQLCGAQQKLTVPLQVGGTRYEVTFPAGSTANGVAREFCVRNAATFGITVEDELPGCVGPIADYLVAALAPRKPEEPAKIKVPLTIDNQVYEIQYNAGANLNAVAQEFCAGNAAAFGITKNEQLPNCIGPVVDFLKGQPPKAAPPAVMKISLTIGGKAYEIDFAPGGVVSLETTAQNFCVRNAASIGLKTNADLPSCIGPVTDYLRTAVNPRRTQSPRMIKASLTIGGTPYEISYPDNLPLDAVAQEFCIRNAAVFGITANEQLPNCIGPVADYLFNAANPKQQKQPQMVTVPLTVGETKYEISFPAGTAAEVIAQQFCVQNAASLGITTNSQLPGCTGPVVEYLVNNFA